MPRSEWSRIGKTAVFVLLTVAAGACKKSPRPGATLDSFRDALATGGPQAALAVVEKVPACTPPLKAPPPEGCFSDMARAFGGVRFVSLPPDFPSTAAAALTLLREVRGDWIPNAESWLNVLSSGMGSAPDALRLAVAHQMSMAIHGTPSVIDSPETALDFLRMARTIPGACVTYVMLGDGMAIDTMPPPMSPDGSECLKADLARRPDPSAKAGSGIWRAVNAFHALWKTELAALEAGAPKMNSNGRERFDGLVAGIKEATGKIEIHRPKKKGADGDGGAPDGGGLQEDGGHDGGHGAADGGKKEGK